MWPAHLRKRKKWCHRRRNWFTWALPSASVTLMPSLYGYTRVTSFHPDFHVSHRWLSHDLITPRRLQRIKIYSIFLVCFFAKIFIFFFSRPYVISRWDARYIASIDNTSKLFFFRLLDEPQNPRLSLTCVRMCGLKRDAFKGVHASRKVDYAITRRGASK